MLTVVIPVYNGARTIRKALDSILCQKTSFNYSILIVNDCSTDSTQEILDEYKTKYPDKINIVQHEVNKGCFHARITGYQLVKTKYFTALDSDDYWITENKLQKAIDFLESNNDYTMYMSNTFLERDGNREVYIHIESKTISHASEYIPAHTSAVIYRNVFTTNDFVILNNTPICDTMFFRGETFYNHLHLDRGKAYFDCEVTSVYSLTGCGIWTNLSISQQNFLNTIVWYKFQKYFFPQSIYLIEKTYNALPALLQHKDELTLDQVKEIYAFLFHFKEYLEGCSFAPPLHSPNFYFFAPSHNLGDEELVMRDIALHLSKIYTVYYIDYDDGVIAKMLHSSNVKHISYVDEMQSLTLANYAHFYALPACTDKLPAINNSTIHYLYGHDNQFDCRDIKNQILSSDKKNSGEKHIEIIDDNFAELNIKKFLLAFLTPQNSTACNTNISETTSECAQTVECTQTKVDIINKFKQLIKKLTGNI